VGIQIFIYLVCHQKVCPKHILERVPQFPKDLKQGKTFNFSRNTNILKN